MRPNWTGGVADACRDRWESLKTTEEYIALGRPDLDDYREQLITELASYYEANIMPDDVRAQYEARNAELDADGPIDLESDDVEIDTAVLAQSLDESVIDLEDDSEIALNLDALEFDDDLEMIDFTDEAC